MDSLLTPNNVLKIWGKAPAADKTYEAQERSARLANIDAQVRDGSYPDKGVPLAAAVAAPKLADDLRRRTADAVDPDDAVEHYERFE